MTAPRLDASSRGVQLLLFGQPHAGKTSLLGALAEAGIHADPDLKGRLEALSPPLEKLREALLAGQVATTDQEVVLYRESFRPRGERRTLPLILLDCDGRAANEILSAANVLHDEPGARPLVQLLLATDALLLVIDAAATTREREADFSEFVRFLRLYRQARGERNDVGGLPVFLVLSKCDLLAESTDTAALWEQRIEKCQRDALEQFAEVQAAQEDDAPLNFGSLDVQVRATAIKHPALKGHGETQVPYKVGALFTEAIQAAAAYDTRQQRSNRRLVWTFGGGIALLASLVLLLAYLLTFKAPREPEELETKIDSYRSREGQTPSARLREPLQPRLSELSDLEADLRFKELDPEHQSFVRSRLQELKDYQAWKGRLQKIRSVNLASDERDLREISQQLTDSPPPPDRQREWSQTEAELARQQHLEDVKALRAAVAEVEDWYKRLLRRADELVTFTQNRGSDGAPLPWAVWDTRLAALLTDGDSPPHNPQERIPGASTVSYATVYRFERIRELRTAWTAIKQRLLRLRDLAAVLGLAGRLPGRPALLQIPAGITLDDVNRRWSELVQTYPNYRQDFTAQDLPDAVAAEVRQAARASYAHLLPAGQTVVARRLQDTGAPSRDSPESWRRLRLWLASPEELRPWRELAQLLLGLAHGSATDPVKALDNYVRKESFDLEVRSLELPIPDAWKMRPTGPLEIHHRSQDGATTVIQYDLGMDTRDDAGLRSRIYRLRPRGRSTLRYAPGDTLWADIALKDASERDYLLTWARSRSQVYQFERLMQPPRLHRRGEENTEGKLAEEATLRILPEQGIPEIPDLVPILAERSDR